MTKMATIAIRYYVLKRAADEDAAERRKRILVGRRRRHRAPDSFAMSDEDFTKTYRLSKSLVINLIQEVTPYIPKSKRSDGMDAAVKVLITLAFYGSGLYQSSVGQSKSHGVSQSSVSRAVQQVTDALNHPAVFKKHVNFPLTHEAREGIRSRFVSKFGFPEVVGCVDSTHVSIIKPKECEETYYCRKGYHSLNVMIVCDADLNILCVDSSNPGSSHESTIWKDHTLNSYLMEVIDRGETALVLGDSGYALGRNLIVPITNTVEGSTEHRFNDTHGQTRTVVERTISVLKSRFRCLLVARQLHYKPDMAAKIVNACCLLHNIANKAQLRVPPLTDQERKEEQRLQVQSEPAELLADYDPDDHEEGRVVQQQMSRLWSSLNVNDDILD